MDGSSIILGTVLLLVLVLMPGMAVTLAVFPRWKQITFIERLGLSVIMGILPELIIYFLNKNAGVTITFATTLSSILLVTVLSFLVYYKRRSK